VDTLELLIRATESYEALTWRYEGPCRISTRDHTFDTTVVATWDSYGTGLCDDPRERIWRIPLGNEIGDPPAIISVEALDGSWKTGPALQISPDSRTGTTKLEWWSMWHRGSCGPGVATVLLLADAPFIAFPDPLPVPPGVMRRHFLERGLRTRLFGRDALLRRCTVGDESFLALAYEGDELTEALVLSAMSVISVAVGRDLAGQASITTSANGSLTARRFWRRETDEVTDPKPALDCGGREVISALGRNFETMAEAARRLRYDEDGPIDVAIKQLVAPYSRGRLDLEIRDVALALDIMVESAACKKLYGPIAQSTMFDPIRDDLLATLERFTGVDEILRAHLANGIMRANETTTEGKRRKFFAALGLQPTRGEKDALKRRNAMSHTGYIETENPVKERKLRVDLYRARTVVNEALLLLLKYDGLVLDWVSGDSRPIRRA
jgi:hypothetical protein